MLCLCFTYRSSGAKVLYIAFFYKHFAPHGAKKIPVCHFFQIPNPNELENTYLFLNADMSVNHASTWTVGANWFLNKAKRLMANYEETYFDGGAAGGGDRQTEKVFSTRLQLSF